MIELHEDALVQYDELDALSAQFVVNHSVGGTVLLYTLQIVRLCVHSFILCRGGAVGRGLDCQSRCWRIESWLCQIDKKLLKLLGF